MTLRVADSSVICIHFLWNGKENGGQVVGFKGGRIKGIGGEKREKMNVEVGEERKKRMVVEE